DRYLPYEYDPPYGLRGARSYETVPLTVDRCGSHHSISPFTCGKGFGCQNVALGSGTVAWTFGDSTYGSFVYAYFIARGLRWRWEVPGRPLAAALTAKRLFVAALTTADTVHQYSAPLR